MFMRIPRILKQIENDYIDASSERVNGPLLQRQILDILFEFYEKKFVYYLLLWWLALVKKSLLSILIAIYIYIFQIMTTLFSQMSHLINFR